MVTTKPPKLTKSDTEKPFQDKVIRWLKEQGCVVFRLTPGNGIPSAASDILAFKEAFYFFLECKKSRNAPKRPGQEAFCQKFNDWSYAKIIWPENWEETKAELGEMLK